MPQPVTIEIPLPPPELWPNARHDEARRTRVAVEYRARVCAIVIEAMRTSRPLWPTTRVLATFFFGDRRKREPRHLVENLETAFDALGDAGVIAAEYAMIRLPPVQEHTTERPRVLLTIEPLGCEEAARLEKEPA